MSAAPECHSLLQSQWECLRLYVVRQCQTRVRGRCHGYFETTWILLLLLLMLLLLLSLMFVVFDDEADPAGICTRATSNSTYKAATADLRRQISSRYRERSIGAHWLLFSRLRLFFRNLTTRMLVAKKTQTVTCPKILSEFTEFTAVLINKSQQSWFRASMAQVQCTGFNF